MTLSDLEERDAKGQTFPDDLRNYAPIVWARATKFGMITLWEKGVFLAGQTHLILRGRGTTFSKFLGFLLRTYLRGAKFGIVTQGGRGVYEIPPRHIPRTHSPWHFPPDISLSDIFLPRKPKVGRSPHTRCKLAYVGIQGLLVRNYPMLSTGKVVR